jgi:S1-C subfamily serine protease
MSSYDQPRVARHPLAACLSLLLLLMVVVISAGLTWWFWPWRGSGLNPQEQPRPVAARGELAPFEQMSIQIYDLASPSLVQVTKLSEGRSFYGLDVQQVPRGVGSGFVWDEDGHIVTNYHVVEGAQIARVTLADHSTHDARGGWGDPDKDIAVLSIQVPKGKLHPVVLGSSHDLKVGQLAFALGDPFGLDQTMTMGIISALGRKIEAANGRTIEGVIQTSAPINPGNSGGPLLDSAGRLVGMNTAIVSPSGASAGIGFAIPVDEINQVVTELIRNGKIVRPRLGVRLWENQIAEGLGVREGALIRDVVPNSPAAQAGLQGTRKDENGQIVLGDVIVAIDGKPIKNIKDLYAALERRQVGETLTVTIDRKGQRQDVKVTLQAIE